MSKAWSFYEPATGLLSRTRRLIPHDASPEEYAPDGCLPIAGWLDCDSQMVDVSDPENPTVIAYTPPPPSADAVASVARDRRDRLLAECDWVVARSVEDGEAVPTEWRTYRQALRDVPQQAGFPESIEWPDKP